MTALQTPIAVAHARHALDTEPPPVSAEAARWQLHVPVRTDSEAARQHFLQGMMLLHLFEYRYARRAFSAARAADPDLAMAYWGEAMAHNHPIWDEQNLEAARAVLNALAPDAAARQARARTPLEADFLGAVDVLYGPGSKPERDSAYLDAMAAMAGRHPDDPEVALFHALALFGVAAGVRDHRLYMESGAISLRILLEHPHHPGAAHYFIHAVDDPVHAPLGLDAARRLAAAAPDAGHAQHMASHIFVALGRWPEVVAANRAAVAAVNRMRASRGAAPRHWGHYHNWLFYGILQRGEHAEAERMLRQAWERAGPGGGAGPSDVLELSPDRSEQGSLVKQWARYLLETGNWDSAVTDWTFDFGEALDPQITHAFVRTLQFLETGDPNLAGRHRQTFETLSETLRKRITGQTAPSPAEMQYLERLAVMSLLLQSRTAWAEGNRDAALTLARQAVEREHAMPLAFGPPFVELPAAESLGRLALAAGCLDEAQAAFRSQLEFTRGRHRALDGLAAVRQARSSRLSAPPPDIPTRNGTGCRPGPDSSQLSISAQRNRPLRLPAR